MLARRTLFAVLVTSLSVMSAHADDAETTPTVTCFEVWRQDRVKRALTRVRNHDAVESSVVGDGGDLSAFFRSSLTLLRFAGRDDFISLLSDSNPVARVMGAYGLLIRSDDDFDDLVVPLREDSTRIRFGEGHCIFTVKTVAETIAFLELAPHRLAFLHLYIKRKLAGEVVPRQLIQTDADPSRNREFESDWRMWWFDTVATPRSLTDLCAVFPGERESDVVRGVGRLTFLTDREEFLVELLADESRSPAVRVAAADSLAIWPTKETVSLLACFDGEISDLRMHVPAGESGERFANAPRDIPPPGPEPIRGNFTVLGLSGGDSP